MKRLISLLIILSMLSTTLFAGVGVAIVIDPPGIENSEQLFSDVQGDELSDEEMEYVEGEGVIGAIMGAVGGAMKASITTAYRTVRHKERWNTRRNRRRIVSSAKRGAVFGAIWGGITGP